MKKEVEKVGSPYLFRYRMDNDFTLDEIKNNYIYFSDRNSLNDPFDSSPDLIRFKEDRSNSKKYLDLFKDQLPSHIPSNLLDKYSENELIELTKSSIPKYLNSFGIACFSMIPYVNMTLWAHYANNHRGICIQYLTENDEIFFKNLQVVKYFEKLNQIDFNPLENESNILDVFYMKDANWQYEKELRLVRFEKGKINLKSNSIRNIICGYKASEKFIESLKSIVKDYHPHIGIFQMDKPIKQNKISLTKIV